VNRKTKKACTGPIADTKDTLPKESAKLKEMYAKKAIGSDTAKIGSSFLCRNVFTKSMNSLRTLVKVNRNRMPIRVPNEFQKYTDK
jgi:hypothetical protein